MAASDALGPSCRAEHSERTTCQGPCPEGAKEDSPGHSERSERRPGYRPWLSPPESKTRHAPPQYRRRNRLAFRAARTAAGGCATCNGLMQGSSNRPLVTSRTLATRPLAPIRAARWSQGVASLALGFLILPFQGNATVAVGFVCFLLFTIYSLAFAASNHGRKRRNMRKRSTED
jgi:hypothetical protein